MQLRNNYHSKKFSEKRLVELEDEAHELAIGNPVYTEFLALKCEEINEVGYRLYGRDWEPRTPDNVLDFPTFP